MIRFAALTISAALLAAPALAQSSDGVPSSGTFKTSEKLYTACTSTKQADLDQCNWYLMGAYDMIILYQDALQAEKVVCTPTGTLSAALRTAWLDYLKTSPNARRYSAVSTIRNAFTAKFKC